MRLPPDLTTPSGFIIEWRARVKLELGSRSSPWPAFAKLANASGATRLFAVNNMKAYNELQFRIRAYNGLGIGFPGYMVSSLTCFTNSKSKYGNLIILTWYLGWFREVRFVSKIQF